MNGVLLIDKSSGPTSHDVVASVRRILGQKRCGHTGTLDPFATGLMMLCLGRATRLARFLSGADKTYVATIRFGYATDTFDRTGKPVGPIALHSPDPEELARTLAGFVGAQMQRPPAFSAKKIGGKRAYELARAGESVSPKPVEVTIRSLELLELDGATARLEVTVSSGTYIRSLAHDVGKRLGCHAHLSELRRTRVAAFSVSHAVTIETLEREGPLGALLTPNEALRGLPLVRVGAEVAKRLAHGHPPRFDELVGEDLSAAADTDFVRLVGPEGELLAVGEPDRARGIVRLAVVWNE
jgi:tRNA pseudouridine55 synthase